MCTIFNKPIIDTEATASNIKTHRIKAGFTVKQIQTIFNFNSPQAIYSWENGSYLPTIDNLIVIASIFGVKVDDILVTRTVEIECDGIAVKSA
jgi:DNA-binding XRE family transcriptional regulator